MFSLYYSLISFRTQNSCTLATEVRQPALVSPVAMTSVGTALAAIVEPVAYSAKASRAAAENSSTLAARVREPALVSPAAMTSVGTALAAIVDPVAYSAKTSAAAAGELF